MRTYDVHYLDDLASLEYGMSPVTFMTLVKQEVVFLKKDGSPINGDYGSLKIRDFNEKRFLITKLTNSGLSVLRRRLKNIGIYPLHECGLSFTDMVTKYNMVNPSCVRDIGEKWSELAKIENEGKRFLKYRELAEIELNTGEYFLINKEDYKCFMKMAII